MNYADAERIDTLLCNKKGNKIDSPNSAQLVVIVGCGVRQSADSKAISTIRNIRKKNPKALIILTGCLSNRSDIQKKTKGIVDIYLSISKWNSFSRNDIYQLLQKKDIKELKSNLKNFYRTLPRITSPSTAYIPIMTGCNNYCSYCVVPMARGKEISFSPEDILAQAKTLIDNGYKEIILLGQNVNSYKGKDKKGEIWSFSQLVKKIHSIKGDFWIKFVSSHPKDVNQALINILKLKKVSNHFHLPIQSGSDNILTKMNRKYTQKEYSNLIKKIKSQIPDIVLTSDYILGFPGETNKDFKESIKTAKEAQFEMLYINKYSPRPQTTAKKLKDDVSQNIKKKREKEIDKVWKKTALEKNHKLIGKTKKVLIDSIFNKEGKKWVLGHTFCDKRIKALLGKNNIGSGNWVYIKIDKVTPTALSGKIVKKL